MYITIILNYWLYQNYITIKKNLLTALIFIIFEILLCFFLVKCLNLYYSSYLTFIKRWILIWFYSNSIFIFMIIYLAILQNLHDLNGVIWLFIRFKAVLILFTLLFWIKLFKFNFVAILWFYVIIFILTTSWVLHHLNINIVFIN